MFQSSLPKKFWPYSLLTTTWMINRLPSRVLDWKSPYEILFGVAPDLSILRPFGCLVYAVNVTPHRGKFVSRSNKCIFLGYDPAYKGYLLYDLHSHKVYSSRDVKFFPDTYHFSDHTDTKPDTSLSLVHIAGSDGEREEFDTDTVAEEVDPIIVEDVELPVVPEAPHLRRSHREHKQPVWMKDYVGNVDIGVLQPVSSSTTPLTFPYIVSPHLSSTYVTFLFNASTFHEPTTYKEASQIPDWVQAMESELAALEANHTWDLVPLPPGKRPIGNKWIFKVKLTPTGIVDKYKARLVAKGYNHEEGIDYHEVFFPVAKFVTVRLLLAIAIYYSWHIHQVDVNNAFLHGFLHDDIYMLPPKGYQKAKKGEVCKLVKSLYGLMSLIDYCF